MEVVDFLLLEIFNPKFSSIKKSQEAKNNKL